MSDRQHGSNTDVPAWVSAVAIAGTVMITGAALWLSWTALTELAIASGIEPGRAWAWPLLVDGVIIVGTVAVVASEQARRFGWWVVSTAACVSIAGNALHAFSSQVDVPAALAACVSGVPAVTLLASTHLTVLLTRRGRTVTEEKHDGMAKRPEDASAIDMNTAPIQGTVAMRPDGRRQALRAEAGQLRASGWSYASIARHVGVHPSTVCRWLTDGARRTAR